MNDRADADIIRTIISIPVVIVILFVSVMVFPTLFSVVTDDLGGQVDTDSRFYSESLFSTIQTAFDSWYALVLISAASGFVYLGLLIWRRQRYSREDEYEDYFR